nr:uncharacterized protein LOC101795770 isoform X2 [Anas platyrhynchos]
MGHRGVMLLLFLVLSPPCCKTRGCPRLCLQAHGMTGGCVHGWGVPFPRDIPCACFQHSSGLCLQQGSLREALHKGPREGFSWRPVPAQERADPPGPAAFILPPTAQVQPHGAVVQGSTSFLSNGAVPSVSCAKGFRKTQGEKAQTSTSPSLLPTPILPQEFKCQHPPATAHISQGLRQHEVRGCPPPRGDAHRLDGAASSVRARLLRIPVPPPVPARCSQPGEDCPAGDRDGDSSLPTL